MPPRQPDHLPCLARRWPTSRRDRQRKDLPREPLPTMANNDQLTTRWIRLQREATRAAKEADDAVVPFAQARQPPPKLQVPMDEDDFGIERLVLHSWRAFFERFRADEAEFERPHYLAAGQVVEDRLAQLGQDARPDII